MPPETIRQGVVVEIWSAISAAVLLLTVAALVWFDLVAWWGAILIALAGYAVLEGAFRRRLTLMTNRIVVALAGVTIFLVVVHWRVELAVAAVVGLAVFLLVDNLREVLGR